MKSLIESREIVTIVLKDGEILRGRIRYYDRDCFSVGQAGGGRRFFLRKTDVSSILLEKQEKAESRRGAMEQPPALRGKSNANGSERRK